MSRRINKESSITVGLFLTILALLGGVGGYVIQIERRITAQSVEITQIKDALERIEGGIVVQRK